MLNPLTVIKAKAQLTLIKTIVTFVSQPRPIVLLGENSAIKLCENIAMLGSKRVLIVTDTILYGLGVISPLEASLKERGVEVSVFSGVTPDPTLQVVEQGLEMLRSSGAEAVLAVGGGSSIDAAKVIALAAGNKISPDKLIGIFKAKKGSLPLYVVPTTAGTGSEVTIAAVISDTVNHQKNIVADTKVVPQAVALDPIVMKGMPPHVTAETGIDALTHAIEAWVSEMANSESDKFASAAVELIFNNLLVAYNDGSNLEAREAMGLASHYAGLALNKGGIGYVHAIAHQLGAVYGVPHGRANAIVLPYILDFNKNASKKRLAELARAIKLVDSNANDAIAANTFIAHTKQLIKDLSINIVVDKINDVHFDDIIASAFTEAHGTYAVPKYMSKTHAKSILTSIKEPLVTA